MLKIIGICLVIIVCICALFIWCVEDYKKALEAWNRERNGE